jgi:Mg/Co/Ni transporter MgtE
MVDPIEVQDILSQVGSLLDAGESAEAIRILQELYPADSSEILYALPAEYQSIVLRQMEDEQQQFQIWKILRESTLLLKRKAQWTPT